VYIDGVKSPLVKSDECSYLHLDLYNVRYSTGLCDFVVMMMTIAGKRDLFIAANFRLCRHVIFSHCTLF
jgi:hypothetical protein